MLVIKEFRDYLFLLIEIVGVLTELQLILTEDTSLKIEITILKLMEEIFMFSQLMTLLSNMISQKSIIRTRWWLHNWFFVRFCLFQKKKLQTNCSWFKQKKALDANSRAIQQIILTGKTNAGAMIYYILEQPKETTLQFCEGTRKVL